jgi:ribosomal protein S20
MLCLGLWSIFVSFVPRFLCYGIFLTVTQALSACNIFTPVFTGMKFSGIVLHRIAILFIRNNHKMPIIKSAIKRMHQTAKRRARNVGTKRDLKSAVKAFLASPSAAGLKAAQSELDTAVKKNVLKKNTASRRKSQLAKVAKEAGVKATAAKETTAKAAAKPAAKSTAKAAPKAAEKKAPAKKPAAKKPAAKKAPAKKTTK